MPIVTQVRKEQGQGVTHEHIEGVCVSGVHYTRAQVVASIRGGESWYTSAGGQTARIKPMDYCPSSGCYATPYITTEPDHTTTNNLENLPRC
jgi:hypothetical protein